MRRNYVYLAFLMCLLCALVVFTSVSSAEVGVVDLKVLDSIHQCIKVSELPLSLITIEESAFEGTALTRIDLPENVEIIGDNAFANVESLRNINIPNSTTYIGKNAFKGSNNVTITGAPKGYARAWAKENGIPFSPIISFYAFNNTVQVNTGLTNSRAERLDIDSEQTDEEELKPTGRMTGELNAEEKETITAFHIQGRSPPMV